MSSIVIEVIVTKIVSARICLGASQIYTVRSRIKDSTVSH